jgi:tRNA pseudouridine55 synthase
VKARESAPSGVLVIDKPRGPTSHDAVGVVRRALGTRAVGHAGTLDPMATGVLVVAVGEATKLTPWLVDRSKVYEATLALGVETDTLDADGRETRRVDLETQVRAALARSRAGAVDPLLAGALDAELARRTQVPPAFSAIQQGGVRSYARARRGEDVELAPRDVRVDRLDLVACGEAPAQLSVVLEASKGYYVRALARDLAAHLGTVAHLTALRRTRSGCFGIDEALPLAASPGELGAGLIPLARAAERALPVARLTSAGAKDARHGRPVQPQDLVGAADGPCAWLDEDGALVAVGEREVGGQGHVVRGFGG